VAGPAMRGLRAASAEEVLKRWVEFRGGGGGPLPSEEVCVKEEGCEWEEGCACGGGGMRRGERSEEKGGGSGRERGRGCTIMCEGGRD